MFQPHARENVECPTCRQKTRDQAASAELAALVAKHGGDPAADAPKTDPELRAALARTMRQLSKAKASKEELVAAIYQAVKDNLQALRFEPVTKPATDRRSDHEETAVVVFSDLQLGQVTSTYNTQIAEERVQRYAEKVVKLTDLQRSDHPVKRCKLYLLGDLAENELIFPGQPHQVDSSLYAQVALDGPRILGHFIRTLLTSFEHVDIVSVPGNHGDVGGGSRKAYNPETNFDRLLTAILRHIFQASGEERVSWTIPDGYGRSSWYAVDYVGQTGFLLWHGHQARRTSSSSHLPFYKLVMGWRSGAVPEPFNVSLCGHHHTPTMLTMNTVQHFINGTFASDAEYAVERLASNSKAAQWLLFASPKRGITASYLVSLDG
jgi:hypothetical protein